MKFEHYEANSSPYKNMDNSNEVRLDVLIS